MTLLSLARAKYHSTLAVEEGRGNRFSISWGLIGREDAGSHDIIAISDLGKFILEALTFIESNPKRLAEIGFIPSIYWYTQAQVSRSTAPSVLEIGLYWVSLEILAKTHNGNNRLGIRNKEALVKRYIGDRGYLGGNWDFLDEAVDDWYKIRNALFHEGNETFSLPLLSVRRQQIRDFASLIFVEMLQSQSEENRQKIAKRIRDY
jgi:hypothetical protein